MKRTALQIRYFYTCSQSCLVEISSRFHAGDSPTTVCATSNCGSSHLDDVTIDAQSHILYHTADNAPHIFKKM